jgi:hypothetical protein
MNLKKKKNIKNKGSIKKWAHTDESECPVQLGLLQNNPCIWVNIFFSCHKFFFFFFKHHKDGQED